MADAPSAAYTEADLKRVTGQLALPPLRLLKDRRDADADIQVQRLLDDVLAACVEQFGHQHGERLFSEATDRAIRCLELIGRLADTYASDPA
jgi:hypothetical protein